ncbi:MAG: outer membrane beta-barrel protein [Candidatus Zixiibacteriota bacterium]|nr:MAG: outer membrane beta-barrel protein [candidate division Zixibacteria bacterium]
MKKLLLLAFVLVAFVGSTLAQEYPIDKASMIIGGTAMFANMSGDLYEIGDESLSLISITPSFGFFVAPGLLIGADFTYSSLSMGEVDMSAFGIGPVVGYYFNLNPTRTEAKGAVYPYVKGFFQYASMSIEYEDESVDATMTSFGGRGGFVFMLSNAVALDIGVQFNSDSYEPDEAFEDPDLPSESVDGTRLQVGAGIIAFLW